MNKIISYFFILLFVSCVNKKENKSDLELEILNDTLVAFSFDLKKDTINVLSYSIQNNSNYIYYFKQGSGNDSLSKKVYKNGIFVGIYDAINKEVAYSDKLSFEYQNKSDCDSYCNFLQSIRLVKDSERLKESIKGGYYQNKNKRHYFFIHPKETLFFKQYINLTDSMRYEDTRINYAHLKRYTKYYSNFYIPSDSTAYEKELPEDVLKTIKVNNVKVYHGIIESKNKVPIKVLE